MRKKSRYILYIVLTIIIGTILHAFIICCCCNSCDSKCKKDKVDAPVITDSKKVDEPSDEEKEIINAEPIIMNFAFGESTKELTDDDKSKLMRMKDYLAAHPDARIICTGYSDSKGGTAINKIVSQKRANFGRNILINEGVEASKIAVDAKGTKDPIGDNETEEGRAQNRRIVIKIQ